MGNKLTFHKSCNQDGQEPGPCSRSHLRSVLPAARPTISGAAREILGWDGQLVRTGVTFPKPAFQQGLYNKQPCPASPVTAASALAVPERQPALQLKRLARLRADANFPIQSMFPRPGYHSLRGARGSAEPVCYLSIPLAIDPPPACRYVSAEHRKPGKITRQMNDRYDRISAKGLERPSRGIRPFGAGSPWRRV
ncbi:hypothetical protein Bbelb_428950 [Branchiostoma belcheri]|nr:hypothetical protein Bbelb_428950 [Branchiostoma belcheri]